ncbi:MAG: hypothetical protein B0D92_02690, partial [Spirochaeta sp. LUC14_002_19_P3]
GLDLSTLKVEKSSFISKTYREYYSDLSASVQLAGSNSWVYILIEHKSYDDPMALMQIIYYMSLKWYENNRRVRQKTLQPIIPILFYHGENPNPPSRFRELFDPRLPQFLKDCQPDFNVYLCNLTTTPEKDFPPIQP